MAFDKKSDISFSSIYDKNLSWPGKKCNKKRQLNNPVVKNKGKVPVGNMLDDSSSCWSISADEDYIVLCFREDKAFDVVKDGKGASSDVVFKDLDGNHKMSRPVNRKLKYDEEEEQVRELNIHEKRSNANLQDIDQHYQDWITPSNEYKKKETVNIGRQQYKDSIRGASQIEGIEDLEMVPPESRDSGQSGSSASSFAFPLLGWEWVESPVQMPKSEDLHLKKQRLRFMRFQCCRF